MNRKYRFGTGFFLAFVFAGILSLNASITQAQATCVGNWAIYFGSWESFGVVRMEYHNTGSAPMRLTDFNIIWENIVIRANLAPGVLTLRQVVAGGNSPTDPLGTQVWSAPAGQDAASPTVGQGEGTWVSDYIFPPNSTTNIHMDFDGTTTNLQAAFGAQLSDFNGTTFTTVPDCSGSITSGAVSGIVSDGRINPLWGDHFAVVYADDDAGNPALRIYRVGDHNEGWLALALDLEHFPTDVEENTLVASQNEVAVYVLTSGEIQVVLGPDAEGKFYTIVMNGLPYVSRYYLSS